MPGAQPDENTIDHHILLPSMALDSASSADVPVPPVAAAAWETMGLNEEAYSCVFRETEQRFEDMSAIMLA